MQHRKLLLIDLQEEDKKKKLEEKQKAKQTGAR